MDNGLNTLRFYILRRAAFGSVCIVATAFALFVNTAVADAGSRVKGQHATSKQPYWKVGRMDKTLSSACQRGEFRQRKHTAYSVGFNGELGRGVTGIANKNWNLIDTKNLAKPGFTYHFFNQGYSNCKVFVAKTPLRKVK